MPIHQRAGRVPGPTQAAFERRIGMPMADWIVQNANRYTLTEAAAFIGYSTPKALQNWIDSHVLPVRFRRHRRLA